MNELMKSFYTQFTDKQLTDSDYQDMVDMYGTDMQAFVRDFEKKYITPQGQEFNEDFYEELTNYEMSLRTPTPINTEVKTVEGIDVPEYKPTTLKYIEQPINQWFENLNTEDGDFFSKVELPNQENMLKKQRPLFLARASLPSRQLIKLVTDPALPEVAPRLIQIGAARVLSIINQLYFPQAAC